MSVHPLVLMCLQIKRELPEESWCKERYSGNVNVHVLKILLKIILIAIIFHLVEF